MDRPLLKLDNVTAGYGNALVLHGISLELPEHGSLAVLGRNGTGKSTLLLTIMGFTQMSVPATASAGWRRSARFFPR
jgi:branched-chain amino acid transport system ATP-binding protein